MIQETIPLINGRVEVSEYGDIIYFDVYGDYTDEDVMHMTQYLEHYFRKSANQQPEYGIPPTSKISC